jgi:hypothetical protein
MARVAHIDDRDVRGSQVRDVQQPAVFRQACGNRMIANTQPRDRAPAVRVDDVELLV